MYLKIKLKHNTSHITNKANTCLQFKDTQIKQLVNPRNLELIRGNYMKKAEQHYSEQQILSSPQPVHLMMAGWAETRSDNKEKTMREY
jgi:hypothetical protein